MSQSKQSFLDYDDFVEKFKPKKTTDDCMTPPEVMEVVNSYVERRWGIDRSRFVRPFWPGGDYEHTDYPDGGVVVDNPPFSMLANIKRFYLARHPLLSLLPVAHGLLRFRRALRRHRLRRQHHLRERRGGAHGVRNVAAV